MRMFRLCLFLFISSAAIIVDDVNGGNLDSEELSEDYDIFDSEEISDDYDKFDPEEISEDYDFWREKFQVRGKTRTCGDGWCKCYVDTADCSGHQGRLKYVPRFSDSTLKVLNFSGNDLRSIDRVDFFQNVSTFIGIELSRNRLSRIIASAFQCVPGLKLLFLDYNYELTYKALEPVFNTTSLLYLEIRHGQLGPIPDDMFVRYPMPRLRTLYMHENHLKVLNMSALAPLRNLAYLGVAGNQIADIYPAVLRNLLSINLNSNLLDDFPVTCQNGRPLFPNLRKLFLQSNSIAMILGEVCLRRLQLLNVHENKFNNLSANMFDTKRFPSLDQLYVGRMNTKMLQIQAYAFNNTSIRSLSLMYNNFNFSQTAVIDSRSFYNLPRLQSLQLSTNVLAISTERFLELFGHLRQLTSLFLGNGKIRQITRTMFANFTSLQNLFMYQNLIYGIPDGTFDDLKSLRRLILRGNQISTVTENTFGRKLLGSLRQLDLSGNPFSCTCDLRWFQSQLTSSAIFKHSFTKYTCKNLAGVRVKDFFISDQACLLSRGTYTFTMTVVAMLIFTMTLGSALFRYRWHIRLMLYEAFRGRGERWRRLQEHHFQYDLFVSYASEDEDWVRYHLLPELEGRWRLRLCTHERDFIPGKNIIENIQDCLETSKKVMLLFSSDFARSQWCQLELAMCMTHVIDNDDALILVRLREIPSRDLTSAMMAVMKTTTYIEWEDTPEAIVSFWGRIRIALQEIL